MISIYRWNPNRTEGERLDSAAFRALVEQGKLGDDLYWVDLENPSPEEERLVLEKTTPVHPLSLEDITKLRREPGTHPHFPKVEEFPEYLFVIVNPLTLDVIKAVTNSGAAPEPVDADQVLTQLSAVLTKKMLVTHHYEPVDSVNDLHAYLDKHQGQLRRGTDFLFHMLLDFMVDNCVPFLEHVEDCLDSIECTVVDDPTREHLQALFQMKRNILGLRKTLIHEREVLARMSRGEFDFIEAGETLYYRNVYDHLIRFTELIESAREMVNDLIQLHLSAMSNRLSEVMKVLALISTILLPMTVITGIYGMNFDDMPELKWNLGYPLTLAIMASIGMATYLVFRWKRWI